MLRLKTCLYQLAQLNCLNDDVQTDGCRDEVGAKERTWNLDGTFAVGTSSPRPEGRGLVVLSLTTVSFLHDDGPDSPVNVHL